MAVRLNKLAREFNVGISTMVEFLHKKGRTEVESNPNTKVDDEVSDILRREFSSDLSAKKESDKISEERHNKDRNKETITLDDGRHEQVTLDKKEQDIPTVVPEESKPKVKVIDKIDLEAIAKPKSKAKAQKVPEVVAEEPVAEPVAEKVEKVELQEAKPKVQKKAPVEKKVVVQEEVKEEKPAVVSEKQKMEESVAEIVVEAKEELEPEKEIETEVFKPNDSKLENKIKVIDKIDLSQINQRTRPAKKSKEEKKKERESRVKDRTDVRKKEGPEGKKKDDGVIRARVKLNGPKIIEKIELPASSSSDPKKKRKRIQKGNERVNINKPGAANASKPGGANDTRRRGVGVRRPVRNEIKEEDVQKQIKDTLARLTNKGKSKGSKYRRDKRDAVSEKQIADLQKQADEAKILKITEFVTVNDLANMMTVPVVQVISSCMSLGLFVSINQRLDAETIALVADEFNYKVEFVSVEVAEAIGEEEAEVGTDARAPIVTVMGHVDHGKTSLLDFIRNANVIEGEAGGITQHIGAYRVKLDDGRPITFLDTPGHEAFTAMRARGAKVTDIAIIIVAADDNIMPQTVEAINHASAAGVPIVFAINKIDKPGANPEKIKEGLANMNYLVEEWGGKYQSQDISAKNGTNVSDLLEKVLLEAEMLELTATPDRRASGSIVESTLDKGKGYIATSLVQNGTLRQGDIVLAGAYFGHVKAMFNERNQRIMEAGPSEPVLILGLNGAPQAGDNFNVMETEKEAREIATKREQLQREQGLRTTKHITLDEIGRRIAIGNFQELNVIVKGDVDGSIEALADSLIKLSTEEIQVNVIHKGVGQISESDIMLAAASNAIVIGFQVRPSLTARKIAEKEEIDIRLYSIIYDAIAELKSAMEGMLSPEIKEEIISTVEVTDVFNITKVGTVAGCLVREGKILRSSRIRLIRDGIVVHTGSLGSLKRFKDDVKEVANGYECGLNIAKYNDIQVGDMVEAYQEVEVKKTLK